MVSEETALAGRRGRRRAAEAAPRLSGALGSGVGVTAQRSLPAMGVDAHAVPQLPFTGAAPFQVDGLAVRADVGVFHPAFQLAATLRAGALLFGGGAVAHRASARSAAGAVGAGGSVSACGAGTVSACLLGRDFVWLGHIHLVVCRDAV